ncbi:D-hexose-6-phosphate mutarotase [Rheinheimera riviphila]|uniref:Putative glucose-6-phosphate 1-epimerase n=1 Tax=Rheinheimera riviphila TaxID=1834037 RepID=A0A437QSP4_9GAMM|nr:D-hexose-6-phosphate mutarotase [Rheinheimera riviphila]RVU37489.1 D-hexose-6-phosphate mutarotase [Rheinheimera riviphila]
MTSSITEITGFGHLTDLPCWQLRHAGATVVVSSYGAHVLHYAAAEQQPAVLWLSPKAVWQNQQPIRGGVPICWPWFGKVDARLIADIPPATLATLKLPNHGLVRTRFWQITEQQITADAVMLELSISVNDLPWTSETVTLRYQIRLDHQLTLTLSCDTAIAQQAALHSYFTVADSRQTQVQPLPLEFYDKVSDSQQHSSSDVLHFVGEIDRVYPSTADSLMLVDSTTRVQISQQGHDASVLWNPAAAKAATSADIPADQWSDFVCVESAKLSVTAAPLALVQIIQPQI